MLPNACIQDCAFKDLKIAAQRGGGRYVDGFADYGLRAKYGSEGPPRINLLQLATHITKQVSLVLGSYIEACVPFLQFSGSSIRCSHPNMQQYSAGTATLFQHHGGFSSYYTTDTLKPNCSTPKGDRCNVTVVACMLACSKHHVSLFLSTSLASYLRICPTFLVIMIHGR